MQKGRVVGKKMDVNKNLTLGTNTVNVPVVEVPEWVGIRDAPLPHTTSDC